MSQRLQILLSDTASSPVVAGLPTALRAAHRAADELHPAKIVFREAPNGFSDRYARQLKSLDPPPVLCSNHQPVNEEIDPEMPLLVVGRLVIPRQGALTALVAEAEKSGKPVAVNLAGRAAAAYYPRAGEALRRWEVATNLAGHAIEESGFNTKMDAREGWMIVSDDSSGVRTAEDELCAGLAKDTDGYIARFDRKFSIALSKIMLKTPITPNDITTASLVLGLLGAWWLASGSHLWQFVGSLVLWFCCILDGCDGEVARLKLLCSPSGAAYDLWADHLAHLATFVAIPFGVHRMFPNAKFALAGTLLVLGFLGCGFSVWWLVLRKPEEERGPYSLLIERVASRDYVYLIVFLTAIGRMDWFLYAAAVGSHVFYLGLWWLSRNPKTA